MRVILALLVGVACVWGYTNEAHRLELIGHPQMHPAAASNRAARSDYVPTNTVAFQKYALELMLDEATRVNRAWSLGLPDPINSDHVTRFTAYPKRFGAAGGITVLDRYHFVVDNGRFRSFYDDQERWDTVSVDKLRIEALARSRSQIIKATAMQLAFTAIGQLGLTNQSYVRPKA
jgi:hypothetical protein